MGHLALLRIEVHNSYKRNNISNAYSISAANVLRKAVVRNVKLITSTVNRVLRVLDPLFAEIFQ